MTATPAAPSNVQSWADDQPDSPTEKPVTQAPNDGFHEVQRNSRGNNQNRGNGQFRGGRGGGRGDGYGRGRGGRGGSGRGGGEWRGGARGGPREARPRRSEE